MDTLVLFRPSAALLRSRRAPPRPRRWSRPAQRQRRRWRRPALTWRPARRRGEVVSLLFWRPEHIWAGGGVSRWRRVATVPLLRRPPPVTQCRLFARRGGSPTVPCAPPRRLPTTPTCRPS
ncbi:hypothetical protein BU14_0167s0018 [Porphyra umbilicalis]|uniref:Uncharacterized protein n=1 Tax=Porphyra umbilicalis TaxID=2786 RepID=A0A1X6P861_PORUM|nr:hypothetical protein BU14_0167s0018 [Porphyra umbilicalis]|eukprot:OSX76946.1 hypothetical protein BU14_0167s0018 [Porphyra umbilicalis]